MNSIKSIIPNEISHFHQDDIDSALSLLSEEEIKQLGKKKVPSPKEWVQFRDFCLRRSLASNPNLDLDLTAFTPGETLELCKKPAISSWHSSMSSFLLPEGVRTVIFVPCAKTKPWLNARRGIYKVYNELISEHDDSVYFVTISEPLAIVPQELWGEFPMYDNPGLFKDVTQRSGGLFTRDFNLHFGRRLSMPWDQESYDNCIDIFANVIKDFITLNSRESRVFISFVNDFKGISTHEDMLMRSRAISPLNMYLKRSKPRESPRVIINNKLKELGRVRKET